MVKSAKKDDFPALLKKINNLKKAKVISILSKPFGSYNSIKARADFEKYKDLIEKKGFTVDNRGRVS